MVPQTIIIYAVVSVLNLLMFTPYYLKKRIESRNKRVYDAEHDMSFFIILIPGFNFIAFAILFLGCIFTFIKYRISIYHQKKYPELISLDILESICKIYKNEIGNHEYIENYCKNFSDLIELLKETHRNPEISHLLLNYEVTLTRILTVLKESKENDENTFKVLLLESKKTIELFEDDILDVKNKFDKIIFEKEEKIATKILEKLELEAVLQQKRAAGQI
jgi:hypothetical protein